MKGGGKLKNLSKKEVRGIARDEAMKVVAEAFNVFSKALGRRRDR